MVKVLQFERDNVEGLKLKEYSRFADFVEVAEIISRCMGNEPGKFIEVYNRNLNLQTKEVIESNIVGQAIEIFIDSQVNKIWVGTITALFELLTKIAGDNLKINTSNAKLWPQASNILSRRINEIKPDLREIGITIEKNSLDKSNREWTIKGNGNRAIYEKNEHISPEQPYRLKPENCAQITRDNSGDMSFDVNHISPCISPEENGENCAQNEQLRRSGDTGDICTISSQKQTELPKQLQEWCNGTVPKPVPPKVSDILGNYVAFDFEWDPDTHVLEAGSFVDSSGHEEVMLRSDWNYSEINLLDHINDKLMEYDLVYWLEFHRTYK